MRPKSVPHNGPRYPNVTLGGGAQVLVHVQQESPLSLVHSRSRSPVEVLWAASRKYVPCCHRYRPAVRLIASNSLAASKEAYTFLVTDL
jgi:hypothetical protein